MTDRVKIAGMDVAESLFRFIEDEALPGSGVDSSTFWSGLAAIIDDLAPKNRQLLERRDDLQHQLDAYHRQRPGRPEPAAYAAFLSQIGYLVEEPSTVKVTTSGIDTEISIQAGPQLVVPLLNARFATNAANARWGSLYDALYGTDAVDASGALAPGAAYNPRRGVEVVARAKRILDQAAPLSAGSHLDASSYAIDDEGLIVTIGSAVSRLADPTLLVGYRGSTNAPEAVVLRHHGLHLEILVDHEHTIGKNDPAGVKDIILESALTSIMDLEDSVAAVDASDKVVGYRNWLRLMQGTLTEEVTKDGRHFTRTMNPDRAYTGLDGQTVTLPGRALMFIRQVGHLMTTDAVRDRHGNEAPEGLVDALVTGLGSVHDIRGDGDLSNSRTRAMYVVKPKMHGPEEVAFTVELFARVEEVLALPPRTIKVGIMDEERRTTLNLKACIAAASDRIAFINTGFLDRTGDEIHTSMHAGPVVRKADMKRERWIEAYEASNVDIGLECGLSGRAQIGKGMWAAPDNMADMLEQKIAHPLAGATCAWVPSPTAATLHAIHYHEVHVHERQRELTGGRRASLEDLLALPLGDPVTWTSEDRQAELDNNVQGTLGYVVRWIDAGVGCSKVPDLGGTPLMEDRATCRISSQHVSNWLLHGVIDVDEVERSLRRMASVVDSQNAGDSDYFPMAPGFDGEAFLAARELLLRGIDQPSGYTEPVLHRRRVSLKQSTKRNTA
ncbi:malate synthase G [Rhodococcoides fascians]|uniref:malate synthase G n=1 Tax=Rhodococcoides fascians TaxID=1828 RepID=UPI00055F2D29|nr:malate synthase G [Rhodococcus fascians]